MPLTVLDHILASAAEVFSTEVAADDDFFALGGDSVAAVELAVLIEDRLHIPVDPDLMMGQPNFAAVAAELIASTGSPADAPAREG